MGNKLEGTAEGKQAAIGDGNTGNGKKSGKAADGPGTSANVEDYDSYLSGAGLLSIGNELEGTDEGNQAGIGDGNTGNGKKPGKAIDGPGTSANFEGTDEGKQVGIGDGNTGNCKMKSGKAADGPGTSANVEDYDIYLSGASFLPMGNKLEGTDEGKQAGIGDGSTGNGKKKSGKAADGPVTSANVKDYDSYLSGASLLSMGNELEGTDKGKRVGIGDGSTGNGEKKSGKAADGPGTSANVKDFDSYLSGASLLSMGNELEGTDEGKQAGIGDWNTGNGKEKSGKAANGPGTSANVEDYDNFFSGASLLSMGWDLKLNELEGTDKGKQAGIGDANTGKGEKKSGKAVDEHGTSANVKVSQSKPKELGKKKGKANPTGVGDDKSITKGKKKFGKVVDVPEPVSISQSKPKELGRKSKAKPVAGGDDKSNTKGKEKFGPISINQSEPSDLEGMDKGKQARGGNQNIAKVEGKSGEAADGLGTFIYPEGPVSINQSGDGAEKTPKDKGKSRMETDGLGTFIPAKEGKMTAKESSSKSVLLHICQKNKIQLPIYKCTTNRVAEGLLSQATINFGEVPCAVEWRTNNQGLLFQATVNIGEVSYVGEWRKNKKDAERSAAQVAIDVFESEGIEKMLDVKFAKLKKQLNDLQKELYCTKEYNKLLVEELMKANERVNKLEANITEANKTIIEYMEENDGLVRKISELNIVND